MAVEDVVTILMEYLKDGEDVFAGRYGSEASVAARDMTDLLREQLGGQLDYGMLWAEFETAPRETMPQLAGVLEAIMEADPGLADKLQVLLEDYYAARGSVGSPVGGETPEAEVSEFLPREDTPLESHQVTPRRHTDEAGEGTYLYGNVPAGGPTSVGKEGGVDLDVLEKRGGPQMPDLDLRKLFVQLRRKVEKDLDTAEEKQQALIEGLRGLEAELRLGEEADESRILEHLRTLGEEDDELMELVLTGLWQTPGRARAMVERAIVELGSEPREPGS